MRKFTKKGMALLLALIMLPATVNVVIASSEFIPIRSTFEAADANVEWSSADRSITIVGVDDTFVFFADSQRAYVNNNAVTLQNNIVIENGSAFIHQADLDMIMQAALVADNNIVEGLSGSFTDSPVIIGEATSFPLNGILSIPNNVAEQVPAVVLVHGTGASDMNGVPAALPHTPNQPFRDIAEYLASNGIAVIRYDKRTYTHGLGMFEAYGGSLTVMQETIEDAILAANMLRNDPRIDENRIFIIGHSMGGMLAPRIHAEGGDFAGLIIFAGSPRFLLDISATQSIMMLEAMLAVTEDDAERKALQALVEDIPAQMSAQINAMLALSDEEAKDMFIPELGASVYYILDMYRNPVEVFLEKATVPILVMQPANDLQVLVDIDFALYKELLADRDNVTFKLYEGLNHVFMTATADNMADVLLDWEIPDTVDAQVLADIVTWIKGQ